MKSVKGLTEVTMTEEECMIAIMAFEEINSACNRLFGLRCAKNAELAMIISDELGNLRPLMTAIGVNVPN